MWNEASQNLMQDMITWNDINEANLNYQYAESKNDKAEMEKYQYQIDQLMSDNCTEEFLERLHQSYLKLHRPMLYNELILSGRLHTVVADLNEQEMCIRDRYGNYRLQNRR